ncbi:hypothetical protein [Yersinia sp. Marseille-Q3913]|uniref:hypothetical protein n=1 Tax=Yersinia sp. Marseille-Q3913 TaxID=2830769 RepID=UPI001BAFAE78|nr:hypothetical protein [Yersinia sp. Marseille-Q3913]MBS0057654.1 hypothetical protein [Yersinia sp. Marseille-Q3913]
MKTIPNISPTLHTKANESEGVRSSNLSSRDIRGRDVVIINPYCEGGGDEALAKKIANIALGEGCRVTISSLDTSYNNIDDHYQKYQSYSLQNEEPHNISQYNDPLFIIAPVGISDIGDLRSHLKNMCDEFNFPKNSAILIEEMDLLASASQKLINYEAMLESLGFNNVSTNRLGFSDGAIGYIPTDEKIINEIKDRFEGELIRLLDSYNMSLSGDNSYHLGYISSDCYVSGTQVFIANTLCETIEDERSACFIMSLRQLQPHRTPVVVNAIANTLATESKEFDYPSLFSKATVMVINSDSGDVEGHKEITGDGTKEVKIILINKLPKNIFDDFMLLADTGMTSGDQSFSEYLTLKETLPYYDMQPWKSPMVESIKSLGGLELENHLNNKIVGRMPFSGSITRSFIRNVTQPTLTPEQLMKKSELDKKISSYIATPHIRELISSKLKISYKQ